jgi:Pterin 4 alpha carbinolamine dehydratase
MTLWRRQTVGSARKADAVGGRLGQGSPSAGPRTCRMWARPRPLIWAAWTTHSAGGITERDGELAGRSDELA